MPCQHVQTPAGVAIVCSRTKTKRCCSCGLRADRLCDWKVAAKKTGTCDKPICGICSACPAPDKDLCPDHAKAWREWKAKR